MRSFYSLSMFFFVFTSGVLAQDNAYVPKSEDWFFYDLTYVMYTNAPEDVAMDGWPSGHSLSLMKDWTLGRSHFSVAAGLGYTSNNYRSNVAIQVAPDGESSFWLIDVAEYKKNKVNLKYLEVPVELRFRTKPNARENFFRIYLGMRLGYRIGGYYQQKSDDVDVRYHGLDSFNEWRLGAYARIGYSNFSLYGYYGLLDIYNYAFERLEGPPLDMNGTRSLALGVSFSF